MTTNDNNPKTVCECGDPDCLKGSQTFTPSNAFQPDATYAMPAEIPRQLLGLIVDEVFEGGMEDPTVIEDIYRVIARHGAKRLADLERVCAGLSQELIDGGWTAQGIRRHCKAVETQRDGLLAALIDALRLMETLIKPLCHTHDLQGLDAIDTFLDRHAKNFIPIPLTAPGNGRQESI